jgi:hypothetical protein
MRQTRTQAVSRLPVSMRDCNLLSDLSVLAPNAASYGVQGAGGLPLGPPAGPPASRALEHPAQSAWDGLPADALRRSAPGLADHPHGLGQHPRHRQQVSMATAAREQHEVRGRHLGCTTLHKNDRHSRLLRLAVGRCGNWTRCGCDAVQGYYVSRPVPPDDLMPGSSSRQRQGYSASNKRGLPATPATKAAWQPQQLLAQVGPPARRKDPGLSRSTQAGLLHFRSRRHGCCRER